MTRMVAKAYRVASGNTRAGVRVVMGGPQRHGVSGRSDW